MLLENITDSELLLYETLCDPIAAAEILFSDFDNLRVFDNTFGEVRLYQFPMMSSEYLIDDKNSKISKKQNQQALVGAGSIYNFAARNLGKSLVGLIIDILLSSIHLTDWAECLMGSYDAAHVAKILDKVIFASENHPFLRLFKLHYKKNPYKLTWQNNFSVHGINMTVQTSPGKNWFGYHSKKIWIEEASKETEEAFTKRVDAVSELGCIYRLSGMTDFTKHSPAGKLYDDIENQPWICNIPQFIRSTWDEKEKAKAIKKHSGESSFPYRIFVKGEIIEGSESAFDMKRVRACYLEKKHVKNFEIDKDNFDIFKHLIVVERPKNCSRLWLCSDVGAGAAPTEIIIIAEIDGKYRFLYNITIQNLIVREQNKIFDFLIQQLEPNFIGIDCGSGDGREVYYYLAQTIPTENLFYYDGSKKIVVGFEKDVNDKIILVDGKAKKREEFMSEWSVKHLKDLLYSMRMEIPICYKFDRQLSSIITTVSNNRIIYGSTITDNHLFDGFKVFALTHWSNEFNMNKKTKRKKHAKSGA